jgi:Cu/Ag efflux protein CusF
MKAMTLALSMTLIAASGISGMTQAATQEHDMSQMVMQPASTANQQGVGIIKAVDAKAGKVQIAHEPIAALKWSAMTMWFVLRTPLPQNLKVGDSVRFEMVQENGKQWVIVKIANK